MSLPVSVGALAAAAAGAAAAGGAAEAGAGAAAAADLRLSPAAAAEYPALYAAEGAPDPGGPPVRVYT